MITEGGGAVVWALGNLLATILLGYGIGKGGIVLRPHMSAGGDCWGFRTLSPEAAVMVTSGDAPSQRPPEYSGSSLNA